MRGFTYFELDPDEKIVYGPVTTTKSFSVGGTPSHGVGSAPVSSLEAQQQLTYQSGRTVGVTIKRVVVEDLEDPDKTLTIPNDQITQVYIMREQIKDQPSLTLEKVGSTSGQWVNLDIRGLSAQTEGRVR